MGIVQTWDTHVANFQRLRENLLPPLDQGVGALLDDLEVRGLLDETLVVMLGEFGRTPRVSRLTPDAVPGRDHWPRRILSGFRRRRRGWRPSDRQVRPAGRLSRLAQFRSAGPGRDDLQCARRRPSHSAPRSPRPPIAALFWGVNRPLVHGSGYVRTYWPKVCPDLSAPALALSDSSHTRQKPEGPPRKHNLV